MAQIKHLSAWNLIATGFYSGKSSAAPGTVGSIVAFLASFAVGFLAPSSIHLELFVTLAVTTTLIGTIATLKVLGSELYPNPHKDPKEIVIDEFAGYFISVIGISHSLFGYVLCLLFFRLFDILKPPPISLAEKLPGAYGVMADDLLAGAFANIVVQLLLFYVF